MTAAGVLATSTISVVPSDDALSRELTSWLRSKRLLSQLEEVLVIRVEPPARPSKRARHAQTAKTLGETPDLLRILLRHIATRLLLVMQRVCKKWQRLIRECIDASPLGSVYGVAKHLQPLAKRLTHGVLPTQEQMQLVALSAGSKRTFLRVLARSRLWSQLCRFTELYVPQLDYETWVVALGMLTAHKECYCYWRALRAMAPNTALHRCDAPRRFWTLDRERREEEMNKRIREAHKLQRIDLTVEAPEVIQV